MEKRNSACAGTRNIQKNIMHKNNRMQTFNLVVPTPWHFKVGLELPTTRHTLFPSLAFIIVLRQITPSQSIVKFHQRSGKELRSFAVAWYTVTLVETQRFEMVV